MSAETETPTPAPTVSSKELEDGVNHLMQGKRHLLVKDYPSAVTSLADACALLAGKYGDYAPELGEPYLCYGKALLELARAESGVIEMAPAKSDSDEDDDEDKDSKDDEDKDSKDDEDKDSKYDEDKDSKYDEDKDSKDDEDKDSKDDDEKDSKDDDEKDSKEDKEESESKEDSDEASKSGGEESAKDGDKETSNKEDAEKAKNGEVKTENGAGLSKSGDEGDDVDDDKEEDGDVNNLQLAWEMLEMAKLIYQKQVDAATNSKDAKTRLSEVLLKLGEVGIESETWPTAIDDLKACLALQKEVLAEDDRRLAETYYHLAVAHSNNNEYEESIELYEKACDQLQVRIDALVGKRPQEDVINQALIDSEITELKELLVEMKERLNDTKTEKDEPAPKDEHDDVVRNGSDSKPASSIAHLVRKKPKTEASETAVQSNTDVKADKVDKTEGEHKRKSEEGNESPATALKKAKLETES